MDIVIPLHKGGSRWQDNELRYCLRSIEKHLTGFEKIYLIGDSVEWIKDVEFIPMENNGNSREDRIRQKILKACAIKEITKDFLFFNDDHFLNKDTGCNFKTYYSTTLEELIPSRNNNDLYQRSLRNTYQKLLQDGKDTKYFDCHTPIVYNKKKFLDVCSGEWPQYGYVIKSFYCNELGIGGVYLSDLKLNSVIGVGEMENAVKGRTVFSMGDRALDGGIKQLMQKLYPTPSRWEK